MINEPYLDKRGLAVHYACSVRWVEYRMADGLPHAIIAGRPKFHTSVTDTWLESYGFIERRG